MTRQSGLLHNFAPAKVNLGLHVLGKREDGYHEIESLVVFADIGDELSLDLSRPFALGVSGFSAADTGVNTKNLVWRAAKAFGEAFPQSKSGHFQLIKNLPVAAGLGGGSADAAACLRLLATANGIEFWDPRVFKMAHDLGADVPVCLESQSRMMRGVGETLGPEIEMPSLPAVLVNPGVGVATVDVFRGLAITGYPQAAQRAVGQLENFRTLEEVIPAIRNMVNDLEPAAVMLKPVIAGVLNALVKTAGAELVRMSGSGATCFAIFKTTKEAGQAAQSIRNMYPDWWVKASTLGSASIKVTVVK